MSMREIEMSEHVWQRDLDPPQRYPWEYQCETGGCVHVFEENGTVYVEDELGGMATFSADEWEAYIAHVIKAM